MIGPQVDLVGKAKFSRRHSELVGRGRFLENFVTARIFDFKRESTLRRRLIEWLRLSKKNGNLVLQAYVLCELSRPDRRVGNIAQPVTPKHSGRKTKLRFCSSMVIHASGEKDARFAIRRFVVRIQQFDLNRILAGYR